MNKIIYNLVYNRKKCLNKKGMALVQVEAYLGRKKKYFSTKVYLKPEQWDNKKLIVKNHPNADALNRLIYEFVATIEKKELELWQQGKRISLELLKNALTTQPTVKLEVQLLHRLPPSLERSGKGGGRRWKP